MLRKDHFNGFKEFEQTVLQLGHDGVADGKKPEEFLNLAVAPSNVVKKWPVVELEAWLEHRIGREVNLSSHLLAKQTRAVLNHYKR